MRGAIDIPILVRMLSLLFASLTTVTSMDASLRTTLPDSSTTTIILADSLPIDDLSTGGFRPLDTLRDDFLALFTEGWDLLQRPASWGPADLVRAGTLTGLGTAAFLADRDLHEEILGWRGSDGDDIVEVVNHFGENEVGLGLAGGLYLPGLLLDIPWLRRAGRHLGQTLLYSAALGSIFKGVFGRHRPFLGDGPYELEGPWQSDNSYLSLPSGHTIVAFSIASTLSAEIDNPWATAGLYSAATATAIGRVYRNQHWVSDVFVGALLASVIGHGVVTRDRSHDRSDLSYGIIPDGQSGGVILSVTMRR